MTDISTLISGVPTGLWIDGESTAPIDGATFPVFDPATGERLATVAAADGQDAMRALDSACRVQAEWAATAPRQRSIILRTAWELVTERAEELALLMTAEMGKALPESRSEVAYGAEFLRWFSEEAVRIQGRFTRSPGGAGRIMVTKVPVGPCLAITPWNFPLAMGTRKIGPALAAGCTMIVKPAAETPLTMLAFAQILSDAGLPPGVVSVLPTSDAASVSAPLLADPRLRKVTFTGSTPIGRVLIEQSAKNVLRTSMELGGNAPFVVFDDADIDAAVDGAMAAKMRNGGEACTAANRLIVANSVREEFTAKLTERIAALKVGPGHEPGVEVGPLVSAKQRASVATLVDEAVAAGARVRTGGRAIDGPGFFYQPTVLDQVPATARIIRDEIFGPVAAITGFDTEQEAIAAANDTEYGLAAYIFTQNLDRALRVAESLESGMVGVNRGVVSDVAAPFGGVKQSGLGSEGGTEGIEEYLDTKYIGFTA
ncbi:succinate-semialdehyde dehydrogenase/glutarate-semialdehyde dehydrogenase [Rhodococcus sp. PvR044]|jgi:succinate-semialdehyde dehydrogenase / glutarate-semialdehyde dehydrogenase|uniref:NAD-dependent succinate-semialdehyde dehydrogenase n=1 Tax=unclassified Rhodococcus (in: high G+C Gram-positive bacteria) TaxID=192944 RepID=UPI000BCC738E|nr:MULTISPECIES: NAD-dependent succinate-semialdehyde dehydrogenase [unclassified Rhodococcus (in: high G+C Gram-positive bacteria)]MBP1161279.1 succinate-semialdehyde dehydrogenase/glutarate-semialdehyde dehydrogenase [Rhodococcus sp. PvR099]PTR34743.1 succinate-semialdehyde dehydrogenase/glutarate-semialdehyde dehydrogenase [Rhodococcus sp. OK611]SNX94186.1 succinate-semialdehyde dehydrogenase / glutarate-semialdehyde dehydrogenase [Rhodococcus sp. OK270]